MDARAREVAEIGDRLFSARLPVLTLWQEIALNFYPERADFTASRALGEEFAAHLMSGLFGGPSLPPTPKPKPPAPMPDMNDPAILEAQRKRRAAAAGSGGRASTILSGGGGMMSSGGSESDYSRTVLG